MSADIPKPGWTLIGKSMNCDLYRVSDELLAMVPFHQIRETAETARSNLEVQEAFWKARGHGGGVIVFMDLIVEQDAEARDVYATQSGQVGTLCYALIGESFFAMASSSLYTGLSRPTVPLQVFRSLDEALPWITETIAKLRGG